MHFKYLNITNNRKIELIKITAEERFSIVLKKQHRLYSLMSVSFFAIIFFSSDTKRGVNIELHHLSFSK